MLKGYFKEGGETSSKRVNTFLVLLTGLILACIPATSGTGLALVGIAMTGGVAGTVAERTNGRQRT